jgi:cytochrome c biogenesis protein CcmG/thiol:disulfide interchange protein DsbE
MSLTLRRVGQAAALGLVAALLGLLLWNLTHDEGGGLARKVERGEKPPAPAFELARLDGEGGKLSLESLRGKVVVVNFWASWCAPCKEEAPLLERISREYKDRGVEVVGVDVRDFSGDARRFARENGLSYPLVHEGGADMWGDYELTGVPETFFVDREGRLVGEVVAGAVDEESLVRNIELALQS